jgi:hypothetical protein
MSAIVNLYVLAPPAADLRPLVGALRRGGFLALPAAACAPVRAPPALPGLRTPHGAQLLEPSRRREVETPAALEAELGRAADEPVLLAFEGLAAGAPGAGVGAECAVGLYAFPGGHRLRLAGEAGEGAALDETAHAWLHLQGEGAPGTAAFQASALGAAVLAAWPGARVVQIDWA